MYCSFFRDDREDPRLRRKEVQLQLRTPHSTSCPSQTKHPRFSGQQKVKEQSLSRAINMKDIFSMTQFFSDIFTTQLFHYTPLNPPRVWNLSPKNHQKHTLLGGNLTLKTEGRQVLSFWNHVATWIFQWNPPPTGFQGHTWWDARGVTSPR